MDRKPFTPGFSDHGLRTPVSAVSPGTVTTRTRPRSIAGFRGPFLALRTTISSRQQEAVHWLTTVVDDTQLCMIDNYSSHLVMVFWGLWASVSRFGCRFLMLLSLLLDRPRQCLFSYSFFSSISQCFNFYLLYWFSLISLQTTPVTSFSIFTSPFLFSPVLVFIMGFLTFKLFLSLIFPL